MKSRKAECDYEIIEYGQLREKELVNKIIYFLIVWNKSKLQKKLLL